VSSLAVFQTCYRDLFASHVEADVEQTDIDNFDLAVAQ
jgi:hypothetical protein